jgi:hypothetical protein
MEWLLLFALLIIAALAIFALTKKSPASEEFPYVLNKQLFSPAERSFYGVLNQAVQDKAVVFGKVRIADILRPSRGLSKSKWQSSFNQIKAKHFDYVICSPDTLSILSVIELDDNSHSKAKRSKRDLFIENACAAGGLTLHRFKATATYSINEVRDALLPPSAEEVTQLETNTDRDLVESERNRVCPKCSSPLTKKVATKGKHQGTEFLACTAFPNCNYTAKTE